MKNLIIYQDALIIAIYLVLGFILAFILFLLSYILIRRSSDLEKISAYECGFNPFEDARDKFDIRFYLVGILFIIFDLEITFLFPWAANLRNLDNFGFFTMFIFLLILLLGFCYEWKKGALDWE